jgi:hypothetical protein
MIGAVVLGGIGLFAAYDFAKSRYGFSLAVAVAALSLAYFSANAGPYRGPAWHQCGHGYGSYDC